MLKSSKFSSNVILMLLFIFIFTGCMDSKKETMSYYYHNDNSIEIFKLLDDGKVDILGHNRENLALYTFKYKVDEKFYPNKDNLSIEIPLYNIDNSDYVIAMRSNYENKYKKSIKKFKDIIVFNSSNLVYENGQCEIFIQYLIDGSRVNNIDRDTKVCGITDESVYNNVEIDKKVLELATDIRNSMPSDRRDSIKDLTYEYINWITNNIDYPINYEKYKPEYVNVSDPVKTLDNKIGVCEDFANLLANMLLSQGVEARSVSAYGQINRDEPNGNLDDYFYHILTEVKVGEKWYLVNPTLYVNTKTKKIQFNGEMIDALTRIEIADAPIQFYALDYLLIPNKSDNYTRFEFIQYDVDMIYFN